MENSGMEYKIVHSIDCPEMWESVDDYSSHRPLLWLACENTDGKIIEAGMGDGSTSLLEGLSWKRSVVHFDNNKQWIYNLKEYVVSANYVINWLDDGIFGNKINLLFVDLAPGEVRKEVIEKYKDEAKVIVAHDTEPGANYVYGMADVLNSFKYRLDYTPEGKPHTTAVSNFIDVTKWVE
jgi:hypothetical protein